jgi:hypothetical protein
LFENLVLNLNFKLIEPLFVSVLNGLSLWWLPRWRHETSVAVLAVISSNPLSSCAALYFNLQLGLASWQQPNLVNVANPFKVDPTSWCMTLSHSMLLGLALAGMDGLVFPVICRSDHCDVDHLHSDSVPCQIFCVIVTWSLHAQRYYY